MTKSRAGLWKLERRVKGFSSHRRIEIIYLLEEHPHLSLIEIANRIKINFRTVNEHVRRLAIAGLVVKHSEGRLVRHELTPRGRQVLTFLGTWE